MARAEQPRSVLAVGYDWASRISAVGFEFGLPPLGGAFLDRRLGTSPLCILLGAVLGFVLGMMHILRFAKEVAPRAPGDVDGGRSPRRD